MNTSIIPEDLKNFIAEEAKKAHYQLVDIFAKGGRVMRLEVILDKDGGITLDECGDFNRKTMFWMDEQGIFAEGYTLDVCSPGLDRQLRSDNDFSWAMGKEVVVNVNEPVEGKSSITGKLVRVGDDNNVTLEDETGNNVSVSRDNIAKAKLWVKI